MFLCRMFHKMMQSYRKMGIRMMISISFTAVTVTGMFLLCGMLFLRFSNATRILQQDTNQRMIEQVNQQMDSYLRNIMQLSDTIYYRVLKNTDFSVSLPTEQLELLYEEKRSDLVSISVFDEDGALVSAAPVYSLKEDVSPERQLWFIQAMNQIENQHFSTPYVQNLFNYGSEHKWVISVSRYVELNYAGETRRGVLLIDLSFSGFGQICRNAELPGGGYFYITNRQGEIIYHPEQQLIYSGISQGNILEEIPETDGIEQVQIDGVPYQAVIKTVGYTGWKLVSLIPMKNLANDIDYYRWFGIALLLFIVFLLTFVNMHLSEHISRPLSRLNQAVNEFGAGKENVEFSEEGCIEVQQLAHSLQTMVSTLRHLMDDIIQQEQSKRRLEMEVLQSQINPHFLYNTLDSVIWLTEIERYQDATRMVSALGKLFRISLSRGKIVIPLKDELEHARHYSTIQAIRYKDRFETRISAEPDTENLYTLKLIIQPILENAIYHGMAAMDEDGLITVHAWRDQDDLYIDVEDNGSGMTKETLDQLLDPSKPFRKSKGSGIGVRNIHQRIQLAFGPEYGLTFFSEPDEGTLVRIHLPALDEETAAKYQSEGGQK